jgi:class 3 adenylate cyclase
MADDPDTRQPLDRKLATILSADVAEYSRLMAEDEEKTLNTFRGHREIFESLVSLHRGRIFNTAGDAILAEFGSAVEAVRCATEIQAGLRTRNDQLPLSRQVMFRIGVNLGDVMLQGTDLLGDGVNVAARLQSRAEPGGICISGSVYDQIRNKLSLSFKALGEQNYKNIPQPVRTYSISGAEGHPALPSRSKIQRVMSSAATKRAATAAVLVLAVTGGYFAYSAGSARLQQRALQSQDGQYLGQICYGPAPNDPARCYTQGGVVRDGKLSGQWVAQDRNNTMNVEGALTASGEIKITMYLLGPTGTRVTTGQLTGSLRDGRINAIGNLGVRSVSFDWHRS